MSGEFPGPGGGGGSGLQFLDMSDLAASDTAPLLHLMSGPSEGSLPGDGTVWRTPRNSSPEFEFGDGVSAVFKSLSVAGPGPSKSGVVTTQATVQSRHILSANTAPFVPSLSQPAIPIPIPGMGNNGSGPQSIHINNFTANLNYPALPAQMAASLDRGESPASGFMAPGHQFTHGVAPHYIPGPGYDNPGHFPAHYPAVTFSPTPLVYLPGSGLPLYHAHPHPALHIPALRPGEAHHSHTQPDQAMASGGGGAGITFGTTPVVSIRTGTRNSDTDPEPHQVLNKNPPAPAQIKKPAPVTFPSPPVVKSPPREIQQPPRQSENIAPPPHPVKKHFNDSTKRLDNEAITDNVDDGCEISSSSKHDPPKQPVTKESRQEIPEIPPPMSPPVKKLDPAPEQSDVSVTVTEETKSGAAPVCGGSWASLFASKTAGANPDPSSEKPTARIQPFTASEVTQGPEDKNLNSADVELGTFLKQYSLKHVSNALLPRGLLNRSNWCFVNAILQALLACPPFYNLMKSLSSVIHPLKQSKSKTPMLDAVLEFINEFSVLETQQINKPQKKDKNRKKDDIVTGISLEPGYVYNMLLNLEDETFKVVDGRQEDAEEFLSCLLNGLSDEMSGKMKLVENDQPEEIDEVDDDDDDDWKEVGARGRSCVTRRVADVSQDTTPIQALALGLCRSCVKSEAGDNSATLQPFYTLQLDIQDDSITSVSDALIQNFASEKLDGYICSKTKKEIEAFRNLSLEELPPILILHLKRFVYDGMTGGVQKVMKQIEFSVDLEISKSILSAECRANTKQRQYKLFSVVYHNGREATKGHYVTDIFHTGYSSWLHCDDSTVSPTCEQSVLSPSPTSAPYILLYRRGDTMVGMERKVQST